MKILANDGVSAAGIKKLESNGFQVETKKVNQEDLIGEINSKNYVALLVRSATKVREDLIDACPNLKLIGRGGVGMDNIDVEYARSKGIKVINTPAASSQSVAELVMAHLFGIARHLFDSNRQMPGRGADEFAVLKKKYAKGFELRGRTLGIIGLGRIGKSLAGYAAGIGMKVIGHDPFVDECSVDVSIGSETVNVPIECLSKAELLKKSEVISLHVPKPSDGSFVLGSSEFSQMKEGVVIINAARGGTIDEKELLENLNSGKIAFAALDVFENEPTPSRGVLEHTKISLSPHIGAATSAAQDRIGVELADQILEYLN